MRSVPPVLAASVLCAALSPSGCHSPKGAGMYAGVAGGASASGAPQARVTATLGNGVRLVLVENRAAPVVAVQAWVAAGAADEPAEAAGAAHFLERQIALRLDPAGGAARSWTSFDQTVFELVVAAPYLDGALRSLAGALTGPAPAPADVERQRPARLEELKRASDDPARAAAQLLCATAFGSHPYGRPLLGSDATVGALGSDALGAFYRRAYVAPNVTLVVVGDFDAAAARAQIEGAFARLPRGPAVGSRMPPPAPLAPQVSVVTRNIPEARIGLGFRIPPAGDADLPALDLIGVALAKGRGARLDLELVRNRALASAVRSYAFSARQAGLLVLDATPAPGRADEAGRVMLDEALRLAREELPADELERARAVLERDLASSRETVEGHARSLGFRAAVAGDASGDDRYLDSLRALSAADVRQVAAKYLRAPAAALVALVPASSAQAQKAARLTARLREIAAAAEARADRRSAQAPTAAAVGDVVRLLLPSGTRLLVLRDASVPIVSVQAMWAGGLRNEDPRTNGVSALVGALLARGTKTRTAEQIAAELDDMGGSLSGFAGRNGVGLRGEFTTRQWERGVELVADCLRNPSFPDDELERARRVLLEQLRAEEDDLAETAFHLFAGSLWKKHPYRLDPLGSAEALGALTRRRLADHYRRHHAPTDLTVAVVGDVVPDRVLAKLQALLGDAPPSPPPAPPGVEPAREAPTEVFRFVAKEQAHVVVGYPGVSLTDPDRFALAVLAEILAGPAGRLPVEMRDKRALASRVTAFSLEGIDPGAFAVYFACSPDRLEAAVQAARAELARVVSGGVSPDEVGRAGRALVGVQALALRRRSALADALASSEAYGQGFRAYRLYPGEIGKVTPADVQRVARRILDDRRQTVAAIKPPDETPALSRASMGGRRAPAP